MRDGVIIDDYWTLYEQINEAERKRQESASIPKLTRLRGHCNKGNCCGYWENKENM